MNRDSTHKLLGCVNNTGYLVVGQTKPIAFIMSFVNQCLSKAKFGLSLYP